MVMKFEKYTSLTNHYENKFINSIVMSGFTQSGIEWVAREKIHGANFSFVTDGVSVSPAKRTDFIQPMESFYGCDLIVRDHFHKIISVFKRVSDFLPNVKTVQVFGELAGNGVQKDTNYGDKDFYCFDVLVTFSDDKFVYLNDRDVEMLCIAEMIKVAPLLGRGTYEELTKLPVTFNSVVLKSREISDPSFVFKIEEQSEDDSSNNIAEGYVLKPTFPVFNQFGRIVIKCKTKKFLEKKNKSANAFKAPVTLSESDRTNLDVMLAYICENRLRNVLSKLDTGSLTARDFGRIHGLLIQDALEEINRETGKPLAAHFENPSVAKRTFQNESATLVRNVWHKILSNEF
ncbi:RNA ligase 2 [Pectobacterium phage POP12]|nr:RNA ligase 2 [Pectobacterium phage POP12]